MSWIDEVVSHSPAAQKLAWTGEMEFVKAAEDDSAGRTVKLRLITEPGGPHPFSKFTRKRRAQMGTRFNMSFAQIHAPFSSMMLELALLNWASNPQGQNVTFQLNGEQDEHPFMGCRRASKDAPGTRWMVAAVEIDDSEQIIEQERRERAERSVYTGRTQTLSNVARLLTKNPTFHRWLSEVDTDSVDWNTDRADQWVKQVLGIESKAELDSDGPEAVEKVVRFHKLRNRFIDWQVSQGITE